MCCDLGLSLEQSRNRRDKQKRLNRVLQDLSGDSKLIRVTTNIGVAPLSRLTMHTCVVIAIMKGTVKSLCAVQ